MAEEWVKNTRSETRLGLDTRDEAQSQSQSQSQVEDIRKELHYCEINLTTEKQMVRELREELRKAREAAQLLKEATEAEKQAAYDLGVQETQSRLTQEFSAVARDFCDITWGKALDVAGVLADSNLR